jgi:hypothetical protein
MTHAIPAELAEILHEIVPPDQRFRHRQHVHLAFIAARRYGTPRASGMISDWIRQLTAHAPQNFNATVTRVWTEIVGHHVAADPAVTDFDAFAERYPALLDKRLLTRHYSTAGAGLGPGEDRLGGAGSGAVSVPVGPPVPSIADKFRRSGGCEGRPKR